MDKNYKFQLSEILSYTPKGRGEFEETATIEFTPPGMSVLNESSDFEQAIMGAVVSAGDVLSGSIAGAKEAKAEEQNSVMDMEPPTPEEVRMLIFVTQKIKVKDVAKIFKKLAVKTAFLDDKTKLKESHMDKMSKEDFIDMMCGYASFFILPSLLRGGSPKDIGSAESVTS